MPIAIVIQALGATSPATGAPLQPHITFPAHLIIILIAYTCTYKKLKGFMSQKDGPI